MTSELYYFIEECLDSGVSYVAIKEMNYIYSLPLHTNEIIEIGEGFLNLNLNYIFTDDESIAFDYIYGE